MSLVRSRNFREEALGDLDGMKAAFNRLKSSVSQVINLEGMAFGHVYHAADRCPAASYHRNGRGRAPFAQLWPGERAIHGIVGLRTRITSLDVPLTPRTTYNIGLIDGGTDHQQHCHESQFVARYHSENLATVAELEQRVCEPVDSDQKQDLTFSIEVVGDRPAGSILQITPWCKAQWKHSS